MILGDSIVSGIASEEYVLCSFPGIHIENILSNIRIRNSIPWQSDAFFILLGSNDIFKLHSSEYLAYVQSLFSFIMFKNPTAKVYIGSLLPRTIFLRESKKLVVHNKITHFNTALQEFCTGDNPSYIDLHSNFILNDNPISHLFSDKVHLSAQGKKLLKDNISAVLNTEKIIAFKQEKQKQVSQNEVEQQWWRELQPRST